MSKYRNCDLPRLARAFKALANPHRLQLLSRLAGRARPGKACAASRVCSCVGELGQDLGIAPSTVSHHLKELQSAGLVEMARNGQRIECTVAPGVLEELAVFLSGWASCGHRPKSGS